MERTRTSPENSIAFYESERSKFAGLARHALLIGNKMGKRATNPPRIYATWLFMRACVTTQSIQQLFDPPETQYGGTYLDHASIAGLARGLIENIAVLLYIGDISLSGEEWLCRKHVIDIHDYINRKEFLTLIKHRSASKSEEKTLDFLQNRLLRNAFFCTLPEQRRKRLLNGDDMFIYGRHTALLKLGWDDDFTRGLYKYLSQQAHSQSMAFHRTEFNGIYERDSISAKVSAGFSTELARRALGVGCLHMLTLFPDIELSFDTIVAQAIRTEYSP